MANSGPGTNGSQFFLVYKDTQLDPNYTPFGTITKGLDILEQGRRRRLGADRRRQAQDLHHDHQGEGCPQADLTRSHAKAGTHGCRPSC